MSRIYRTETKSPSETKQAAKKVLELLRDRRERPLILALEGELGSGKTTFIQGLARALGIREKIQSPTFVLMKVYNLDSKESPRLRSENTFLRFVHVDAYRIERLAEARHLGLEDIFKDRDAIVVIEWADRIKKFIPRDAVWLHFRHKARTQRVIRMTND